VVKREKSLACQESNYTGPFIITAGKRKRPSIRRLKQQVLCEEVVADFATLHFPH
jgi:hypothetical protein